MTSAKTQVELPPRRTRPRALLFHLGAMVVVLSPLVAAELVLRLCVPSPDLDFEDPYVSFSNQRPLFVLDSDTGRFETAKERLAAFRTQSFAAAKAPETLRIFCLGGSTVQGRPYSVETSFTSWLKLNLDAARGDAVNEVINCGGISYASYRLVPILRELLEYKPDLFIICTGHNEFLEDRTYRRLKSAPPVLIRLHRVLLGLRSYQLADHYLAGRRIKSRSAKTVLSSEVQTKLDSPDALNSYRRDETWRQGTIEHFHRNLDTMVRMARGSGVPVIVIDPAANLKDCPPFKSEFRSDLSGRDIRRVAQLHEQAKQLDWNDAYGKIRLLEQAVSIDSKHAGILFLLGKCYEHIGRFEDAKRWFVLAKEEDICPLRILEPMREVIGAIATQYGAPLVDAQALAEQHTSDRIAGDEWLLDHVHPTIAAHQQIGDALMQIMVQMSLVSRTDDWQGDRQRLWQRHLSSLNDAYYAQGAARLQRLHEWSRGHIPPQQRPDEQPSPP